MDTLKTRSTGTVKWFDSAKGYGFIVGPETVDVMVHFSDIEMEGYRTLHEGDRVSYDAIYTEQKRWKAQAVQLIDQEAAQLKAA